MPSRTKAKTKSSGVRGAGPRDPERTSASILAAAVTEFTDKGYAGARIDSIAAKSGANKRMIYHYFGDKDGLYLAVLESAYIGIRLVRSRTATHQSGANGGDRETDRLHLGLLHRAS